MIKISYTTYHEPNTIVPHPNPVDVLGNPLIAGSYVSFNRSGDVLPGKIVEIKRWEWKEGRPYWFYLICEIHVENLVDGSISKIKNPRGILLKHTFDE